MDDFISTNELIFVCRRDLECRVRAIKTFCKSEQDCLNLYNMVEELVSMYAEQLGSVTNEQEEPFGKMTQFLLEMASSFLSIAVAERALDFENDEPFEGTGDVDGGEYD